MKITEKNAKSILGRSKIYDYVINPYVGCQHNCSYCYARFMKRFTGHKEPWGDFVDIKINAPQLLSEEIKKKKPGTVWMSGVCDPYQPLEARYQISRKCLEILALVRWPVAIQTRSPLVLRDMDILKESENIEVGLSVTTANNEIRRIFEPKAPAIGERLRTLERLHRNGIRTFAMIAPILPEAGDLIGMLAGNVDYIILDRMNYWHADHIYRSHGWKEKNTDAYFHEVGTRMASDCHRLGVACRLVYE
jgi:DNA repair photolyase